MNIIYLKKTIIFIIFGFITLLILSTSSMAASYTYDNLQRLTSVTYDSGVKVEYTYDATGNITSVKRSGGKDLSAPSIPANLVTKTLTDTSIHFTWTASQDNVKVTGYEIYRDEVKIGTSDTPSYSETGLKPATSYKYTIKAYDKAGNVSEQSRIMEIQTLTTLQNKINTQFETYMQFISQENAESILSVMDPSSAYYEEVETLLPVLFEKYNFTTSLVNSSVVESQSNGLKIKSQVRITAVNGSTTQVDDVEVVFSVSRVNNEWKITEIDLSNIQPIFHDLMSK